MPQSEGDWRRESQPNLAVQTSARQMKEKKAKAGPGLLSSKISKGLAMTYRFQ
jgi:hypothetical protein